MCHTSVQSRLEARRVKHQLQVLSQAEALATHGYEQPLLVCGASYLCHAHLSLDTP